MDLFEALLGRRTIKDFSPEPVPAGFLDRALGSGLWAQNHRLTEPWRFTVLGPQTHRHLAAAFGNAQAAALGPDATPAQRDKISAEANAKILSKPLIVAVGQHLAGDAAQRQEDYAAIACAIQNIQLAAWADGVGMQWSSGKIIQLPQTYEVLDISRDAQELIGLLFFGFPAKVPAAQARKPLAEVCRHLP